MQNLHLDEPISGAATHQIIGDLVAQNPRIAAVNVFFYSQPPLLQERLHLSPTQSELLQKAALLHDQIHLPFWDSVMLSLFDNGIMESDANIFEAAALHQKAKDFYRVLSRNEILDGALDMLVDEAENENILALSSRVVINTGEERHIPLLDFHCPLSNRNDSLVECLSKKLFGSACVIMNSGKSYHCIALQLVSSETHIQTLYRSLFYSPIVDRVYIAHQLLESASALRLSQSTAKPTLPRFKFIARAGSNSGQNPEFDLDLAGSQSSPASERVESNPLRN